MKFYDIICRCCKKKFYFQPARGTSKINLYSLLEICPACLNNINISQIIQNIEKTE